MRVRSLWLLLPLVCLTVSHLQAADVVRSVRVMSFNIWHGGDGGKQPLNQTAAVIRAARADIVGLQETAGLAPQGQPRPDHAARLARMLGWHYLDQGGRTGIISRFPIEKSTPRKWGALIRLDETRTVYMFNAHFAASPYQPYQLLDIPYGDAPFIKTEAEAVRAAKAARGEQVARLLSEVGGVLPQRIPVFITGDFNEPSHRDWTRETMAAGICPLPVRWPTTLAVEQAGFVDAYRAARPDPVRHPGLTWTPLTRTTDPKDHHDRIDFVFVREQHAMVRSGEVLGEADAVADTVVSPYPSDHRAVVVELELP